MKKFIGIVIAVMFLVMACSTGSDTQKLEKGTPAYDLAVQISQKVPFFDPDKNNVLVSTDIFKVSTGEVLKSISDNMGSRSSQLASLDTTRIKDIIKRNATNIAEKKLLMNGAKAENISIPATEVDSILNLQYLKSGSKEKYIENLKSNGIDLEFVRKQIEEGMLIDKYLNTILAEDFKVTEDDIQKAYQEDKTASVRHILLQTQGKSDSEKVEIRKKMEGILKRARKGEDFSALAKKYSEDPGSKDKGGLYENFGKGRMVKPFEDAAFSVPIGGISDIIETAYGYHILKVIDRKKETKPLDEIHDQLRNQMEQQKKNEAYQKFMESLKEKANFEIIDY